MGEVDGRDSGSGRRRFGLATFGFWTVCGLVVIVSLAVVAGA
jgi:hypothetical protein